MLPKGACSIGPGGLQWRGTGSGAPDGRGVSGVCACAMHSHSPPFCTAAVCVYRCHCPRNHAGTDAEVALCPTLGTPPDTLPDTPPAQEQLPL